MNNLYLVVQAINGALAFVVSNKSACLARAIPIMLALSVIGLLPSLFVEGALILTIIQTLLYSVFAVSWHRYTLLPAVREQSGFPLQLGWREVKFGLVSVANTIILIVLFLVFTAAFSPPVAIFAFGVAALLVSLMTVFIFPAIALDQPLQLRRFLHEAQNLFIPFVIGILYSLFFLAGIAIVIAGLSWLLTSTSSLEAAMMIIFFLVNVLVAPFLIAVATSAASYLLHATVGLRFEEEIERLEE